MLAPHQTEAVAHVMRLLKRRGGLVLADAVGLGKSWVAAEVVRRWLARPGSTAELIVPSALVGQWKQTLAQFETAAAVTSHDAIARQPFMATPGRRLVVVDEAHAFRNPATLRYAALAKRTAASAVLLVTATPVCNSLGDLHALVRLVARDDLLADAGLPSIDAAFETRDRSGIDLVVDSLVLRRERDVLETALAFGTLQRRVVRHPVPALAAIDRLRFPLAGEAPLLRRFLRRRLESSPAALAESLRRQRRFYVRALSALAAGRLLPKRAYRDVFRTGEDREAFQEVLFWELFAPPAGPADPGELHAEMTVIDALLEELGRADDAKKARLKAIVAAEREPFLVFTSAAATARDLHSAIGGLRRCGLITSRERTRGAVIDAFRAGRLDAIVSTDLAAEGLNLQRAGTVIHYDLPWNPVRLEQRNGRAHRIGQKRPVVRAIYFVPRERTTGVMAVVARKNRERRRTFRRKCGSDAGSSLPTLRPRLDRRAAYLRLQRAFRAPLPAILARRHKAGIELIMEEMSGELLTAGKIDDLVALVRCGV